LTSIILY